MTGYHNKPSEKHRDKVYPFLHVQPLYIKIILGCVSLITTTLPGACLFTSCCVSLRTKHIHFRVFSKLSLNIVVCALIFPPFADNDHNSAKSTHMIIINLGLVKGTLPNLLIRRRATSFLTFRHT